MIVYFFHPSLFALFFLTMLAALFGKPKYLFEIENSLIFSRYPAGIELIILSSQGDRI